MAKHNRRPESLGQAVELCIDFRGGDFSRFLIAEPRFHLASSSLDLPPAGRFEPGFGRNPKRNPEEPARQRIEPADRTTSFGQDQERRLRGVFRVMNVAQDIATNAKDHRPVALDQASESRG